MKELQNLKEYLESAVEYKATRNYYYEDHICPQTKEKIRVSLKMQFRPSEDRIILFGKCPMCQTIYYHETYEASRF